MENYDTYSQSLLKDTLRVFGDAATDDALIHEWFSTECGNAFLCNAIHFKLEGADQELETILADKRNREPNKPDPCCGLCKVGGQPITPPKINHKFIRQRGHDYTA
ncbi:hypothetical protein AJ79_01642 [Helicocarpus griseus UAMH5409]|uniref:Uncharacterized protein n=1 Tax=Helicocarpus griseus UAMH5409 TaxID=1447875 RepID=A0A2B7Y7F1_9EURO|nr:hypothetical protein AJ79_01642 [Helicocarpus griseus UAMH5409]